ncbi:hypothetical protein K439DRAFT_1621450 [Ramaria rubella]|nr:hypothetical protein K439DRAFT_1623169 [Ramaria rubella]KAF8578262.1 hypothetical protein K439DRAFT_1621450 [Ramaria rubella]
MLELDTMTTVPVFEALRHVTRFGERMVKDTKTGEVLRANHLVKGWKPVWPGTKKRGVKRKKNRCQAGGHNCVAIEIIQARLNNYKGPELGPLFKQYVITKPDPGNEFGEPHLFKLMSQAASSPPVSILGGSEVWGHFLNFSLLFEFQLQPCSLLMRPNRSLFPQRDLSACRPLGRGDSTVITVGAAVDEGIIVNETLDSFVKSRVDWVTGVCEVRRQGSVWLECVLREDGRPLVVRQALKEPIVTKQELPEFNKKALGRRFGRDLKMVTQAISEPDEAGLLKMKDELQQGWVVLIRVFLLMVFFLFEHLLMKASRQLFDDLADGRELKLTPDLLTIKRTVVKQSSKPKPNVKMPVRASFPHIKCHRALLRSRAHNLNTVSGPAKTMNRRASVDSVLPPTHPLAPHPCGAHQGSHLLGAKEELQPLVQELYQHMYITIVLAGEAGPGGRYARNNELSTSFRIIFCVERDTTSQLIGSIEDVLNVVRTLVRGDITWTDAGTKLKV